MVLTVASSANQDLNDENLIKEGRRGEGGQGANKNGGEKGWKKLQKLISGADVCYSLKSNLLPKPLDQNFQDLIIYFSFCWTLDLHFVRVVKVNIKKYSSGSRKFKGAGDYFEKWAQTFSQSFSAKVTRT